jgi:predicted porin
MKIMIKILLSSVAGLAVIGGAQAADLPTKKTPPAPPATNCYASFYDWLDSTAADCPLSYMGVTVYGQIDVGADYNSHGVPFNGAYPQGIEELISKNSQGARYAFAPNNLSQSNVGIKIKEEFMPGWSLVGDVNTGFDPYSLQLANGPKAMSENNFLPIYDQSANGDSSRAGQWDNTRAYLGLSNATFGTLTVGRQYAFSNDLVNNYDPMGGSYAFSLIGYSSTYVAGVGDTEVARYNTSVKYQVAVNNFRAGAEWQFGGYDLGNGSDGAYQFDLGADYAGFSVDAIYSYAQDAVSLSTYNAVQAAPVTPDDLKATLADISAVAVAGKYTYGPFKAFAGYDYARFSNPTDSYALDAHNNGFTTLGDYHVLPGVASITAYTVNKVLQTAWVGGKYSIRSDLDITAAYYYAAQNNYTAAGTSCGPNTKAPGPGYAPQGAANSACAGNLYAVSGMIDWRPLKRLDVYAGLMYSKASGGIANGYLNNWNVDPTVGLRLSF